MKKIISYQSQEDLLQFSFLEDEFEIICPDTVIADSVRARISKGYPFEIKILSISNFLEYFKREIKLDLKSYKKSDLMLELGAVWKVKFNSLPISTFFRAFQSVLDLRSVSLEMSLFNEVLKEYDEQIATIMKWFMTYMEQKEICDEHYIYGVVARMIQNLPELPLVRKKQFLLLGFSYLSAGKIDFINSLASKCDVYIAVPSEILKKAKNTDWVKWIINEDSDIIDLLKNDHPKMRPSLHYSIFPKGRMSEFYNGLPYKRNDKQVFLGTMNPNYAELCEVSEKDAWFKIPSEFLKIVMNSISRELKDMILNTLENGISIDSFIETIDQKILAVIQVQDFRRFKILSEYKKTVTAWKDLSEVNHRIYEADFHIIEEVIKLRLPKVYHVPCSQENCSSIIQGIEGLWSFSLKKEGIFCVTSNYSQLSLIDDEYGEKANQILTSLGPVKNSALNFEFIKSQILEFLSSDNSILFIEEGLIERNMLWNEIWREFNEHNKVKIYKNDKIKRSEKIIGPLSKLIQLDERQMAKKNYSLTPSKLQLYLDCPRKFYFSILNPIPRNDQLSNTLSVSELGEIQHKVIHQYLLNNNKDFSYDTHSKLCWDTIDHFSKESNKSLVELDYKNYGLEVISFTKQAIIELQKLYSVDPEGYFEFEVKLGNQINGTVDCIFRGNKIGIGILDFKRSNFSIPSLKSFEEKEKIQIWFYLNLLNKVQRGQIFFGYVNLMSPEESLIYANSEDLKNILQELKFMCCANIRFFQENLEEHINLFNSSLTEYWNKLQKEENFYARPRNVEVCKWCSVNMSCTRGIDEIDSTQNT